VSLTILNNVAALTAENSLAQTSANLQKTLHQLSTGLRINSGADDAAGLSIVTGLTANIAALTQSSQNASNAIGLLQTADGALSQVNTMLNRAVTLATEASSSGLSSNQSGALNSEYQSILSEIGQIGSNTNFNGNEVFSASAMSPFLSDGASSSMLGTPNMSVGALTQSSLGLGGGTTAATPATSTLTLTANLAVGNSVTIGSTTYTFQTAAPASAGQVQLGGTAAATLQNLANAVNGADGANSTNASASALASGNFATFTSKTTGSGSGFTATGSLASSLAGSWSTTGAAGRLGGGVAAVAAVAGIELSGGIIANGDTITLGATTYTFVTTLDNSVANQVLINANLTNTCNSLRQAMYGYGNIGVDYSMATVPNATVWADGMLGSVQGFTAKNRGAAGNNIPISISSAGIDVFQPFQGGSDGVAATASLNLTSNLAAGDALSIGGTTYRLQAGAPAVYFQVQLGATAAETLQNLANAINGNTHDTSVTASRSGNTLNITESPAGVAAGSSGNGLRASGTLNATSPFSATAGSDAVTTASTDLNNTTNAQTALTAVSNAINIVSQTRGRIGANVNQLTAASNVMSCQTQNLQNAVNNLANADIGKTVANMTQSNVLQSTGMAALQETNQAQQAVLKLLQ